MCEQVVASTVTRCRGAATCEDVNNVYVLEWPTYVVTPVNLTVYIIINYHNLLLTYLVIPVNLTCPIMCQLPPVYIIIIIIIFSFIINIIINKINDKEQNY